MTINGTMTATPQFGRRDPAAARLLSAAADGARLDADEATLVLEQGDLLEMGMVADAAKRARHGDVATYLIDRNINYTNVCVTACRFCAFYRPHNSRERWTLSHDEMLERVAEAVRLGATQVMIQGGHHPDLGIEWYEGLLARIKREHPDVAVHSLGPPEVVHIAAVSGIDMVETLARLQDAGLDSLPGAGAEILVDRVRKLVAPLKISTQEWLDVMEAAHGLGMRSTVTMMMGMVETPAERVEHLARARDLQDRTGGFRAFISWPYQPTRKLKTQVASGVDYLRLVALSRIFLDNVDHIGGSWLTTGHDVGQMSLSFGADDLGSVMLEENVVRAAGTVVTASVQRLAELIRGAGLQPAQRDTQYRIIAQPPAAEAA